MDCFIAMLRGQCSQFNCKISQSIFPLHNPSAFHLTLSSGQTEPRLWWQCPNILTFWSSGFFCSCNAHLCGSAAPAFCHCYTQRCGCSQRISSLGISVCFCSFSLCPFLAFSLLCFLFLACLPLFPMYALKNGSFSLPKE